MASAAALVAAQCARTAEAMGAKKDQLASAISGTSATDILTLTAGASTSLTGAATLKERNVCKNRLKGSAPVLPIEENDESPLKDFQQCLPILAKGANLNIETSNSTCMDKFSIFARELAYKCLSQDQHFWNNLSPPSGVKESLRKDVEKLKEK